MLNSLYLGGFFRPTGCWPGPTSFLAGVGYGGRVVGGFVRGWSTGWVGVVDEEGEKGCYLGLGLLVVGLLGLLLVVDDDDES